MAVVAVTVVVLGAVGAVGWLVDTRSDAFGQHPAGTSTTGTAQPAVPTSRAAPGLTIVRSPTVDLPDPLLVASHHQYYLYLSTAFGDVVDNIPLMVGAPGHPGHWSAPKEALPTLPPWALPVSQGGKSWSPYVTRLDGRYVMYYAPTLADHRFFSPSQTDIPPVTHCVGIATSTNLAGPFTPVPGPPLVCQTALGGDIDAVVFKDPQGPNGPAHPDYLIWKSDNNNLKPTDRTTVWAAPLANNGLALTGKAVPIFSPDQAWQQPVLEAPQMIQAPDGSDWMFFSAGEGFSTSDYGMGAVQCLGPLGGCFDTTSRPLVTSNAQGPGPGEETLYEGPNHDLWILYSPWHTGMLNPFRPVDAAQVEWSPAGPYLTDPSSFPQPG